MKKLLFAILFFTSMSANALEIGGAYATLVNCTWGQYGNQWGNIGTYNVNGQMHQIFYGNSYCQY